MAKRIDTGELERRGAARRGGAEEPVELRRYLDALRRSLPLIGAIVLVLAVSAYLVSRTLPKSYSAQATIVEQDATLGQGQDADSVTRALNTAGVLLTSNEALAAAAREVPGETSRSLVGKVRARVDPNANLIYVTATDSSRLGATAIANALATTFVAAHGESERRRVAAARADLLRELRAVRGTPGSGAQVQAIQQRLSQLGVTAAGAGTDLAVAERATVPTHPDSPHPLRNALLGVVLGLFLGVLVALGRDQLVPRVGGSRSLARLLDLPVLVSVPFVRARGARRVHALSAVEHEAYQTLATLTRFALPPGEGPHVLLVTSALHGEGKSTVTARLGRALAHGGHRTLLVSGDLRWPTLHELADVPLEPGLSDLLAALPSTPARQIRRVVKNHIQRAPGEARGVLDVLPSGPRPDVESRVLPDAALGALFAELRELDYVYVLVDAPSLLGVADAHAFAQHCTTALFVARLDRLTLENAVDARDLLDRIECEPIGIVVIGGRTEVSPYHLGGRMPALEDV